MVIECPNCGLDLSGFSYDYDLGALVIEPPTQISQAEQVEYWHMVAREIATFNSQAKEVSS